MSPSPATTVTVDDLDVATGTMALITLRGAAGKPATLERSSLAALREELARCAKRAQRGEIIAVGLAGSPGSFAAGADLGAMAQLADRAEARELAEGGHAASATILDLPVPTFAFLTGTALGGGLELALACRYRIATADLGSLGLPETSLGLVPGWGGCYLLPRLVGPEQALRIIIDNPARRRTLDAQQALDIGLVDSVQAAGGDADFRHDALSWATGVLTEEFVPERDEHTADAAAWQQAIDQRRASAQRQATGGAPAALRALGLVEQARAASRPLAYADENDALVDLIMSDEMRANLYAFNLTKRRRPETDTSAPPVSRVGILGAGLMAGQLAMVLAGGGQLPVVMRELDAQRAEGGLRSVHEQIAKQESSGRLDAEAAENLRSRITTTTDVNDLASSDLILEAVFEELVIKQRALHEVEGAVGAECVFATNTSALSITAMGETLDDPSRLVGLHFFNPVAQMPLVEVVRTPHTSDAAHAAAINLATAAGKTVIECQDAPGFVVNRILVRLLGEVLGALEEGTMVADADVALVPMGLPMGPFQLLQLVGPAVAKHVLDALRAGLGPRYPKSPGLDRLVAEGADFVSYDRRPTAASPVRDDISGYFGSRPHDEPLEAAGLLSRVQDALAEEVDLMLSEGVVAGAADIDLAMILGAGWPLHNGGLTPYLDRCGATAKVRTQPFHPPGHASVPPAQG